jgi:glycosyltransferase involved in cell wall biosynthesis
METKKFLFLTTFYPPYHIGGDAVHAYQLANELCNIGHEVHVIHLLDSYLIKRKNPRNGFYSNNLGINIHAIKSPYGILSLLNAYILGKSSYIDKQVESIIRAIEPDVLHHQNIAGFGPDVLKYSAANVLYTAHDYWLICPLGTLTKPSGDFCNYKSCCAYCSAKAKRPVQLWRYTFHASKSLSKIDMIISPSEFLKSALEYHGIKKKVISIPNFVPFPQGEKIPLYPFSYFLFVGALESHKGVLNLIETFKRIKDKTNSKLLLVGGGSLESAIRENIIRSRCSDRIVVLGEINDQKHLQNLYANAQAVVIPSIGPENFPLVALEALANGTPIIVSDQGGLPEIAGKLDPSLIFAKNDFRALGTMLSLFNKDDYNSYNVRAIFAKSFSKEKYMTSYLSLLK